MPAVEPGDIELERRERLAAVERAEERAAQLRTTLEHMADGVILVDAEGKITYANAASARLTGLRTGSGISFAAAAERLRMSSRDGTPLEIPEEYASLRAIITGEQASTEVVVHHEDGRDVTLAVTASPILTREGKPIGAVSVMHDITEQTDRQRELEDLNRLKDEFLSLVSHELKTPMTTVLGYGHLLQRQFGGQSEDAAFAFRELISEANRMVGIINTLLETSRIQAGSFKETLELDYVDLVGLVERYVRSCAVTYPGVEITKDLPGTRLEVMADQQRLEQVLANLIDNAVRYNSHAGRVWVTLAADAGKAILAVRDEGPGVDLKDRETIFESYGRGERKHKSGLGLGLYIAHQIVVAHEGTIRVEGAAGEGATFLVCLPLVGNPA